MPRVQLVRVIVHKTGQWWLVNTSPPSGTPTIYTIMEGTQDDALNLPNGGGISGPYTAAEANAKALTEPLNKTQPTPFPGLNVTPGGGIQVSNPLTGLAAVGDFFYKLTEKQTWTRVGEVALGGILIYAGVRALTHGSAVAGSTARASVTRPAKKVAKKTAKVVIPEARLAGRVAAKRAAPKTTARVAAHRQRVAKYGARKPVYIP